MNDDDTVLAALEQRVRSLVASRLRGIVTQYGVYLTSAIKADPAATGAQLTSRPQVHTALTTALAGARTAVEGTVRAAYAAASTVGATTAAGHVGDLGHDPGTAAPAADYLDAVLADVRVAFDLATLDIVNTVRDAYDGVTGTAPAPARVLVVTEAADRAVRRLGVRVRAAAVVALHRGYTDGQNAVYTSLAEVQPHLGLSKRWEVRADDPCPACAALHGTTIALADQFDASATTDPGVNPPPVYRDLLGPPRHPNCRCRIVLVASAATRTLRVQLDKAPPSPVTYLSAADIRRMSSADYVALTTYLNHALTRVRALLRKIRDGG